MSGNYDTGDWKDEEHPATQRPGVPENLQEASENTGEKLCETEREQEATAKEPEEEPALLRHNDDELWGGFKEDRVAKGQPLAPEDSEVRNEMELGGSEWDEDTGYFQKGPEEESWVNPQDSSPPEEEQKRANAWGTEADDSMYKDKDKDVKGANYLTLLSPREEGGPGRDEVALEFPVGDLIQSLGELVSQEDPVECPAGRVEDFTGDDHQEAGETFAERPPDVSSWGGDEAKEEGGKCNLDSQLAASREKSYLDRETESTSLGQDNIDHKEDQDLCPGWMAVDSEHRAFIAGETDNECKSKLQPYAERTVEPERFWSDVAHEMAVCLDDPTCSIPDKDLHHFYDYTFAGESIFDVRPPAIRLFSDSDDDIKANKNDGKYIRDDLSRYESAPAITPPPSQQHHDDGICEDSSLTTVYTTWEALTGSEANNSAKVPLVSRDSPIDPGDEDKQKSWPPAEAAGSASAVSRDPFSPDVQSYMRSITLSSNQESVEEHFFFTDKSLITLSSNRGSVEDDFFYPHEGEALEMTELGHDEDDEYEDKRDWEEEQGRIQAFYEFYNDSNGEIDQQGRKIKVHFNPDRLSQVIHYESEEDSFDSSTEAEEEVNPEYNGTSESDTPTMTSDVLQYNVVAEKVAGLRNTQIQTRKQKCLGLLRILLKMFLVIGTGLMLLWWSLDDTYFLGHPFFKE